MAVQQSAKMSALRNLSAQLPVANQKVAAGQQAARDIQLQRAVKAAPVSAPVTTTAQTTGAAAATQAGQQAVQGATQAVQQQGQVGQIGLAEQGREAQARTASLSLGANEQKMDNVQRLARIDERLKKELYDDNMSFQKDELGRTIFNERQLSDYARSNARDDQQFQNYAQQAEQISKRTLQAMEHAYRLVEQDLNQKYMTAKQSKDQKTQMEVERMKAEARAAMEKAKNKAANRAAAWQAGGTIAGTVAGGILGGGPQGATAGGGAGGALGGAIGGIGG
jgi:hypothetical protein